MENRQSDDLEPLLRCREAGKAYTASCAPLKTLFLEHYVQNLRNLNAFCKNVGNLVMEKGIITFKNTVILILRFLDSL